MSSASARMNLDSFIGGLLGAAKFVKDPQKRKRLQEGEQRAKALIERVCESSEDYKEIGDAFWELRDRRDELFETVWTAIGNPSPFQADTPPELEEVDELELESSSRASPLTSSQSPLFEVGSSKRPLSEPERVEGSTPIVTSPVDDPQPSIIVQEPETILSSNSVTIPISSRASEKSPEEVVDRTKCVVCRPGSCSIGQIKHCSQICGEVANITWVICGNPSSQLTKPVFSQRQVRVVHAALGSKENEEDLLNYADSPEEGQKILNLMQWIFDSGSKWPSTDSSTGTQAIIRSRLRQLIAKFSLRSELLPESLFLTNVTCEDKNSCHGGAFADISRGKYPNGEVALKRLRIFQVASMPSRASLKKQLYQELLMWRNLSHPHVLPVLGIEETIYHHSPCIVLPWMENGSIRQHLKTLTEAGSYNQIELRTKVLNWIHQATLGIQYLHNERVVHGDFRGDNILIDNNEDVRVTDFGMSVFALDVSDAYGSMRGGNFRWLAPELMLPELSDGESPSGRPTFASDIYSFACVCIELYTDQIPFANELTETQVPLRVALKGARPSRPRFFEGDLMDDSLWSIVQRCWAQKPADRPDAEQLVAEISAMLLQVWSALDLD